MFSFASPEILETWNRNFMFQVFPDCHDKRKQICSFIFWENLWRANLFSALSDLYRTKNSISTNFLDDLFFSRYGSTIKFVFFEKNSRKKCEEKAAEIPNLEKNYVSENKLTILLLSRSSSTSNLSFGGSWGSLLYWLNRRNKLTPGRAKTTKGRKIPPLLLAPSADASADFDLAPLELPDSFLLFPPFFDWFWCFLVGFGVLVGLAVDIVS